MEITYQNINKKAYRKPAFEEVELDREMSLVMISGEPPGEPNGAGDLNSAPAPDYKETTYTPAKSPFGGSRPAY